MRHDLELERRWMLVCLTLLYALTLFVYQGLISGALGSLPCPHLTQHQPHPSPIMPDLLPSVHRMMSISCHWSMP